MIKIIKHGNTHKRIECTKCGCVFEFTGDEVYHEGWGEKFDTIDSDFRIWKVKDHSQLAISEKIDFLSVVDVTDHPTEKGGENDEV